MSEQNIEQNSRHTFIPARQKQRIEKCSWTLFLCGYWRVPTSRTWRLKREKLTNSLDQYSETWGGGGSAEGGGTGLGGAGTWVWHWQCLLDDECKKDHEFEPKLLAVAKHKRKKQQSPLLVEEALGLLLYSLGRTVWSWTAGKIPSSPYSSGTKTVAQTCPPLLRVPGDDSQFFFLNYQWKRLRNETLKAMVS